MNLRMRTWGDAPRMWLTSSDRFLIPQPEGRLRIPSRRDNRRRSHWVLYAIAALLFSLAAAAAPAQEDASGLIHSISKSQGKIEVIVQKSRVVHLNREVSRVSVVNPEIADVQIVSAQEIVVTGQAVGETTLVIWDEEERNTILDVVVTWNVDALQAQVEALFPKDFIACRAVEGAIVLDGSVSNLDTLERVVALAESYSPEVLNMLTVAGAHQVLLEVRIAELSRKYRRELGTNFVSDSGNFQSFNRIGGLITPNGGLDSLTVNDAVSMFFGFPSSDIEVYLQGLQQKGILRILAEPNLVAASGEEASFLVGGEFPVPVVQGGGGVITSTAVTIVWKEFGVRLNFTPTVYGDGRIRLNLKPEVSDLDFSTGVETQGFVIPSIMQRKAESTVELLDNQSFAIAGLIDAKSEGAVRKVPALGQVPILGALFRSSDFQEEETELVMIVTPHLISPLSPEDVENLELPGETFEGPTDRELFMDGRMEPETVPGPSSEMGYSQVQKIGLSN